MVTASRLGRRRRRLRLTAPPEQRARTARADGTEVRARTGRIGEPASRACRRRRRAPATTVGARSSAFEALNSAREARGGAAAGAYPVARAAPGAAAPGSPASATAVPVAAPCRACGCPVPPPWRPRAAPAEFDDHLAKLIDPRRQGLATAARIARRPTAALWHRRRRAGRPLGRVVRGEAPARRCHPQPRPGLAAQAPGPTVPGRLTLALGSRGATEQQRTAGRACQR